MRKFGYFLQGLWPEFEAMKYHSLKVWHLAHELARETRRIVRTFPRDERYELCSQLRRATLSVPTNLVEGSALKGPKAFLRHVRIAIGSLREAGYLYEFARDEGYLRQETYDSVERKVGHVRVLLYRLAMALERAQDAQ
jgi:four helix bundle protein